LAKGASKVYAIDTIPARLALAEKAGANVIAVDFKKDDPSKRIRGEVPQGLDGELNYSSFLILTLDSVNRLHNIPRAQNPPSQS